MGTITYDHTVVEFDDRTLTHLEVVIVHRYRVGTPLLLSWLDPQRIGDGRSSMWMTPTAPVHFKFSGSRVPAIDRDWIAALSTAAGSGTGLVVVDSKGAPIHAIDQHRVHH